MNTTAPDVIIQCICDCFQKDEIEEIENSLVPYNLHLKIEQDSKPQFLNSPFEWFFPVLQILLAPETQTALCQGLASSACYDGIIYLCFTAIATTENNFWIYTDSQSSYVVAYRHDSQYVLTEVQINNSTITIDLSSQRILQSDDLTIQQRQFEDVIWEKGDQS